MRIDLYIDYCILNDEYIQKEEVVIVAAVDAIKKELNKNKDEIPVDKKDLSALEDLLMG